MKRLVSIFLASLVLVSTVMTTGCACYDQAMDKMSQHHGDK